MPRNTQFTAPPMKPSEEAKAEHLDLAREQGASYERALRKMVDSEAHSGAEVRVGEYVVAIATEKAEGMYHLARGELEWHEPEDENVHVEVSVRDGADGRFIPGLTVKVTLVGPDGNEVGTHEQPFLWHPWLYHYGRNWKVPGDGKYEVRVRIEPPAFMRHDKVNGKRYASPVEATFTDVDLKTGRK